MQKKYHINDVKTNKQTFSCQLKNYIEQWYGAVLANSELFNMNISGVQDMTAVLSMFT